MILCHGCGEAGYESICRLYNRFMCVCVRCDLFYDHLNNREW
jgi:hypothetical protein